MFLFKKIVSHVFFPVPLCLEFLLAGLFLLWFTRRQRAGKALVTCGTLLLMGFGNIFSSNALLRSLERRYPPFNARQVEANTLSGSFIAILGGWADEDPNVPITSHVSPDLLARLIEGVRLHRDIPDSKLILSGGYDSAEGMAEIAEALGVSAQDILQLSAPRDTEGESQQIAPLVGAQRFILVTSASHMPRAMGLFRKRGMHPIAAPADYLAPVHPLELDDLFPDAYKIFKSQIAVYEYLGLAWEKLRRKM